MTYLARLTAAQPVPHRYFDRGDWHLAVWRCNAVHGRVTLCTLMRKRHDPPGLTPVLSAVPVRKLRRWLKDREQ